MQVVRGLAASTHPGPTVVVTVLTVALSVAAGLDVVRTVVLTVSVLAGQISVGLSNDAIDAARDRRVGRTDKPIAAGVVDVRVAMAVAVVGVVVALALSAVLGAGLLAAHAIALAGAWAYNVRLKSTAWSIAPFVVSFALLPSFATLAAPDPHLAAAWAWIAGAALGAAVHLTNVLPDLDDDRRTAVHGLPHRLGARTSAILAVAALVAGAAAVLVGSALERAEPIPIVGWVFFGVVAVLSAATLARATLRPPDRTVFRLVMLSALVLAAQLVAVRAAG